MSQNVQADSAPEPTRPADADAIRANQKTDQATIDTILGSSKKADNELRRHKWFDDSFDKWLFLGFFAFGFAAIMAVKLTLGDPSVAHGRINYASGIAAGLAALLMVSYAGIGWLVPRLRLQSDRLGDNCYYLGLLYTLASLSAALFQLGRTSAADRGELIETLLGSFGVALISTILGIALRVIFLQMRREVDDLEEQIRSELNARFLELKDQMLFAVTELETFRLRTQQVLHERLNDTTNVFVENLSRAVAEFSAMSSKMVDQTDAIFDRQRRNVDALQTATQSILDAAATLAEKIRAVDVPRDLLSRKVDAMAIRIDKAGERIEAAAASVGQRISALDLQPDLVTRKLEGLAGAIGNLERSLNDIAEAEALRARSTAAVAHTLSDGQNRIAGVQNELVAAVGQLRELSAATTKFMTSFPAASEAAQKLSAALESQAAAIQVIARSASEDARQIQAFREQTYADLSRSREALGRTQETLEQIVRVITDRLGN